MNILQKFLRALLKNHLSCGLLNFTNRVPCTTSALFVRPVASVKSRICLSMFFCICYALLIIKINTFVPKSQYQKTPVFMRIIHIHCFPCAYILPYKQAKSPRPCPHPSSQSHSPAFLVHYNQNPSSVLTLHN